MAGKTPIEAVDNFAAPIRLVLSCVTRAVPVVTRAAPNSPQSLILADQSGDPVRLTRSKLAIGIKLHFRVIPEEGERGPWRAKIDAYYYSLNDESGKGIIAYHWHPSGSSPEMSPHLHLEHGAQVGRTELVKAHIPTGRISVDEFIRFVIVGFNAPTLRNDWQRILDDSQRDFESWRNWGRAGSDEE